MYAKMMAEGVLLSKIDRLVSDFGSELEDFPDNDKQGAYETVIGKMLVFLRRKAYDYLLKKNERHANIIHMLKNESQWFSFKDKEYLALPWEKKFAIFCDMSGIDEHDLSNMLEIELVKSSNILKFEDTNMDNKLKLSAMDLTSLLQFLFQYIGKYENFELAGDLPEAVRKAINSPEFLSTSRSEDLSFSQPPWAGVGLKTFLSRNGRTGISTCYTWVK